MSGENRDKTRNEGLGVFSIKLIDGWMARGRKEALRTTRSRMRTATQCQIVVILTEMI